MFLIAVFCAVFNTSHFLDHFTKSFADIFICFLQLFYFMFQFTNLLLKVFNFRIFYFLMRVGAVYKPTFDISGKELACFRVSLVTELTITIGQVWTHDIYMLFWAVFSILAISVFEMATNNVFHSQMSWLNWDY